MGSLNAEPQIDHLTVEGLEKVFSSDSMPLTPPTGYRLDINQPVIDSEFKISPEQFPASPDDSLLKQVQQFSETGIKVAGQQLSKQNLAEILEAFAQTIRAQSVTIAGHNDGEINELRKSLVAAQDKIIQLLSEQVSDRAQIASLEARLQFLPDMQAQADRAMAMATEAEHFRKELKSVKFQFDTFRRTRLRTDLYKPRKVRSWWSWVCTRVLSE